MGHGDDTHGAGIRCGFSSTAERGRCPEGTEGVEPKDSKTVRRDWRVHATYRLIISLSETGLCRRRRRDAPPPTSAF